MRRSTILVLAAAAALVLVLSACNSGAPSSTGTSGTTGGGTAASSVTVTMANLAFDPAQVDVAAGGSVTFVNNDTVQHNVAGDTWASGPLDPGKSFTQTFPTAGTVAVRCTIHPSMTMTVNVK